MKFTKWAIAIAMAGSLSAGTALAQGGKPATKAQRTAFAYGSYDYYAAEEPTSPSDRAPEPAGGVVADDSENTAPAGAPVAAPASNGGYASCDSSCATPCHSNICCTSGMSCPENCCESDAYSLFGDCCFLKRHDLAVTGWINGGITFNEDNPASRFNGVQTFNDRDEEGQMNQLYLVMQKAVDTSGCDWSIGGRLDLLYGTDARFSKSIGLELHQDGNDRWNNERFYQLAMPQAYVELGRNDWSIKLGHFYTIIGYEVVTAPDNFFYSHAYTFQYGEPFTHTGVLATKKVSDQFSYSIGLHRGWDQWEDADPNDNLAFLGGVNFSDCDGRNKLALAISSGDELAPRTVPTQSDNRTIVSAVYTHQFSKCLTYIAQSDVGRQQNGSAAGLTPGAGFDHAEWYGLNQYLLYQMSCNWWSGIRAEVFRDDDGTRVGADNSGSALSSGNPNVGPYEGTFYEVAVGLNYKPNAGKNLIVRPELRYDHFDGRVGASGQPYDDGFDDDQFTAAIDAIFKW